MCYNHSSLFPIGWPSMRLYCFHHLSFWRNQLIDNTVMAGPSSVEPSQTAQAIRFSGPITPQSAEVTGPRPVLQCFPHPICHAATTLLCPYMTPDISCVWWRVYQHINSSGSPHYYTVPILDFWGPYGGGGGWEWMRCICPCFTRSRIALAESARETVSRPRLV